MKFPHLYRIVGTDEMRPQLSHALVTKLYTYATNTHVMVRHITEKIFDESFVASLPEQGIALNSNILKAICRKDVENVELFGPVLILKSRDRSLYPELSFDLPDVASIKFPNHNSVMFTENLAKPISDICISARLYSDLMKAMDPYGVPFLKMYFRSQEGAILVKLKIDSDFYGADGLIMPAMY
jgi:hypothetical protein